MNVITGLQTNTKQGNINVLNILAFKVRPFAIIILRNKFK